MYGDETQSKFFPKVPLRSNQTIETYEQLRIHQLSVPATELKQIIRKELTEK